MAKDYITTKQAAELLGVTDARIRQMLLSGELEGEQFGHIWRVPKMDVLRLQKERAKGKK